MQSSAQLSHGPMRIADGVKCQPSSHPMINRGPSPLDDTNAAHRQAVVLVAAIAYLRQFRCHEAVVLEVITRMTTTL